MFQKKFSEICTRPELKNCRFVLIRLDREKEKNGFLVDAHVFDQSKDVLAVHSFGYPAYEETTEVEVENNIDFVERQVNSGAVVGNLFQLHTNRTRDGILVDDDFFTDIPFVFWNVGTKPIKVDGNQILAGDIFVETIHTKPRKERRDEHRAGLEYAVKHYGDDNLEVKE